MNILVTGGAGFIGSAFVRLLRSKRPDSKIVVYDKMTYAGNLANLKEVENDIVFVKGDIADAFKVEQTLKENKINAIVNFAAETHVDRSIMSGLEFIETDVMGTYVLLTKSRELGIERYVQVSTDEVYGTIPEGSWTEESPLLPNSPYSASKAGGDMQVRAAFRTYGIPAMITRGSNTYGPNQYPEKIIPLFVTNLIEGKKVPVYGDGKQVRDWLYVDDHAEGILTVLEKGQPGEVYNLGSKEEKQNLEVTKKILGAMGKGDEMIEYVKDRAGHDRRYSMNSDKSAALGWSPKVNFEEGLKITVDWYKQNESWWKPLKDGSYLEYYKKQYQDR